MSFGVKLTELEVLVTEVKIQGQINSFDSLTVWLIFQGNDPISTKVNFQNVFEVY